VVRGRVELPTFRFQVKHSERCADLQNPGLLMSDSALSGMWKETLAGMPGDCRAREERARVGQFARTAAGSRTGPSSSPAGQLATAAPVTTWPPSLSLGPGLI
jgi:hypothetical protein